MNETKLLHDVLYLALVEIRSEGHETGNKVVFHLADLFHNVVLHMGQAALGESDYPAVLADLREQAAEKGCSSWLDNAIDHFEKRAAGTSQGG